MSFSLIKYQNGEWVIKIEYRKVNKKTGNTDYDSHTYKFDNNKYKINVCSKKRLGTNDILSINRKLYNLCIEYDNDFEKECDLKYENGYASDKMDVHNLIIKFLDFEKENKAKSNYSRDKDVSKYVDKKLGNIKLVDLDSCLIQKFIDNVKKMQKTICIVTAKPGFEKLLNDNGFGYTRLRKEYRENPNEGINNSSLKNALEGKNVSKVFAEKLSNYTNIPLQDLFEIQTKELPMAYNTKKKYTAFLSKMLAFAKKKNYIKINYFTKDYVDMFKNEQPNIDKKCMNFEEFKKYVDFLSKNDFENKSIIVANLILAETGMRREELLGLTWNNINLEKKSIKIENTVTYSNNTGLDINKNKTKNRTSNRTLDISEALLNKLKEYKEWQNKKIELNINGKVDSENDWVFKNLTPGEKFGNIVFPNTINDWVALVTEEAGIGHYTPHNIRHTYISYLVDTKKLSFAEISKIAGHSSIITTLSIYTHLLHNLDDTVDEVSLLNKLMNEESEKSILKKDNDLEAELKKIKELREQGLITSEVYEKKQLEIIEKMMNN